MSLGRTLTGRVRCEHDRRTHPRHVSRRADRDRYDHCDRGSDERHGHEEPNPTSGRRGARNRAPVLRATSRNPCSPARNGGPCGLKLEALQNAPPAGNRFDAHRGASPVQSTRGCSSSERRTAAGPDGVSTGARASPVAHAPPPFHADLRVSPRQRLREERVDEIADLR